MKKCPLCAEEIQEEAIKCKHCGAMFNVTGETHSIETQYIKKSRKWWLAAFLSLIVPGLGHIYNGKLKKGIILLVSIIPLYFIGLFAITHFSVQMLIAILLISLCYYGYSCIDAIIVAKNSGDFYPTKYNKIYVYMGIYIISTIFSTSFASYIKSSLVQAFKIPAGSMEDTLLIGDHILADKSSSGKIISRGDIVVFEYPEDPTKDFIKRVVALPGEVVEGRNKKIYINGKLVENKYEIHKEKDVIPKDMNPRDFFGPITVPDNAYFVMGDNRDRSYDSRFWGFVDANKVKGKAKTIYWSWDKEMKTVRWQRIGQKIL